MVVVLTTQHCQRVVPLWLRPQRPPPPPGSFFFCGSLHNVVGPVVVEVVSRDRPKQCFCLVFAVFFVLFLLVCVVLVVVLVLLGVVLAVVEVVASHHCY